MAAETNADHPLTEICRRLVTSDTHHLAAGVMNLDTETTLAVYYENDYFTPPYVETLMAASAQMFRGPATHEVDELMSALRNQPFVHHIREITFQTPKTCHFLCIAPDTSCVLILVAANDADFGETRTRVHASLADIAAHCPPPITF